MPILTKMLSFTDASLAVLGSLSIMGEYVCYSLVNGVSQAFLMWLGPPVGVISNASVIAFRSLSTKLVSKEEKGDAIFMTYCNLIFVKLARSL